MQRLIFILRVIPVSSYLIFSAVNNRVLTVREGFSALRLACLACFAVKNPASGLPSVYSAYSVVKIQVNTPKISPRHRQRTLV
jgi:hypothetical protein